MQEFDGRTLTYDTFCTACLEPNLPAIIRHAGTFCDAVKPTGAALPPSDAERLVSPHRQHGPDFAMEDLRASLSPAAVIALLGPRHRVPAYCSVMSESGVEDTVCKDMELETVVREWKGKDHETGGTVYLKDWHMQSDMDILMRGYMQGTSAVVGETSDPSHVVAPHRAYTVPPYLGEDWMHRFSIWCCRGEADDLPDIGEGAREGPAMCETQKQSGFGGSQNDYRFCYMGPPGTWTPLHYDVFGTYSWSLNVCGEKLWYFPDPAGNEYLRQCEVVGFPHPPDARVLSGVQLSAVTQFAGDLVFVPSHYFHQVHNVQGENLPIAPGASENATTCEQSVPLVVSINHNWCNRYSLSRMIFLLTREVHYLSRMVSMEDLKVFSGGKCDAGEEGVGDDWEMACRQRFEEILLSGCNWNVGTMLRFLRFVETDLEQGIGVGLSSDPSGSCTTDEVEEKKTALQLVYRHRRELEELLGTVLSG